MFINRASCIFSVDHVPWLILEHYVVGVFNLSPPKADASIFFVVMDGPSNQPLCLVRCAKM